VRERFKVIFHGDAKAKLTKTEEVGAGIIGGTLACWCVGGSHTACRLMRAHV
jgi:hypothetical protein